MARDISDTSIRFLVTGSNGFIGSRLALSLESCYHVRRVIRSGFVTSPSTFSLFDILDSSDDTKIRDFAPTHLIHCAGLAHRSFPRTSEQLSALKFANVLLPLQLARLAKRLKIQHFIFLSTIGVHGSSTLGDEAITEDTLMRPSNPYAMSKVLAEFELRNCLRDSCCNLSIIRPALVYGLGMPGNLRKLIKAIDAGFLFPFKSIYNRRSFVSLVNLISAIETVALCANSFGDSFVVADRESISTADLIRFISRVRNRHCRLLPVRPSLMRASTCLPLIGGALKQMIDDFVVDSSKIRQQLSWRQPLSQFAAMTQAFSFNSPSPF